MITVLVIVTAVLLLLAVLAVRMREFKLDINRPDQDRKCQHIKPAEPAMLSQVLPITVNIEPEPGMGFKDLNIGDTVHFETENGSKYRFTLTDREYGVYRLRGVRTNPPQVIEMDVVMRARFIQDRSVTFHTMDFMLWKTTPIKRLLVA